MVVTWNLVMFLAAAVCFAIALAIVTAAVGSGNASAWALGGSVAFALGHISVRRVP